MSERDLRLRTMRVERDGHLLLDVESLHAPASRCTVVVGEGDSSKTLLASCLAGAVDGVRGEVRIGGRSITGPPSVRMRHGLAAVANTPLRLRGISVAEALSLAAASRNGRGSAVLDVFDRFPLLVGRRTLRAERLSGGEHQALRIACAYVARPDVLVLDSPTTGLAAAVVDAVVQLARDEAARGAAVLWLDQPGAPLPAQPSLRIAGGRVAEISAAAVSRTALPTESG